MIRAVLDSNIWISGTFWHGPARALINLAHAKQFLPLTSHAILHEIGVVLVADFEVPPPRVLEIQRSILSVSALIAVPQLMPYPVRDPKDLHVISCALAGHAETIVTGDRDLLTLRQVRHIPVWTLRQFLDRLAT